MKMHVDKKAFTRKPTGEEIGGIKARFTKPRSIQEITVKDLAAALQAGQTIQPGVTPFSDRNRGKGKKGTCDDDFKQQQAFFTDIDNKNKGIPLESPETAAEKLKAHNLTAAFMYPTFSSSPELQKFRIAVICNEVITDRAERDSIQAAFIALFPQADPDCINADRIFFGTDKPLIEGVGDLEATCGKADLLALADAMQTVKTAENGAERQAFSKFGDTIPTGQRHGTLVSFASTVLTKYGISEKAYEVYLQRVAQCEEPKPDAEIEKIWRDACKYYEQNTCKQPGYMTPAEYAFAESLKPSDYTDVGQANVFVSVYGDAVKYTPATKFLVYNGAVWQESELKAQGLSQELTEKQLVEARRQIASATRAETAATESGDETKIDAAKKGVTAAKNFHAYVLARRRSDKIKATLTEARPKVEIDVMQLDANEFLLNTPAGTVDLKSGELLPHSAQDYCTKITAVGPDRVNAEMFEAFLQRVTVGDAELQTYLQEVAGMCAVGKVLRENLIIASVKGVKFGT